MARREGQGLQIALILFVITTLILFVITYLFWNWSQTLTADNTELKQRADQADDALRTSETENGELKHFLGFAADQSFDGIKPSLEEEMKTYGQGLPEEQQNFRELPAHLLTRIQDLSKQLAEANQREQQLIAEKNNIRQEETGVSEKALAAESKAAEDLKAMRGQFEQDRAKLQADLNRISQALDAGQRQLTEIKEKTDKQIAENNELLRQKEAILQGKNDLIKTLTSPDTFEVPDGSVSGVMPGTDTVWIDVGQAHGLRPKITFSVYDADQSNLATAEKKASIEVMKVHPRLAEAKIIERDYANPILPGDVINTPLWVPNGYLRFALLGRMDIDGDGSDDRQLLKNLIQLNGGKVDAEDLDGRVQGEMTVNTRYLVQGDTSISA
jgi:hypothetical protein